MKVGVQLVVDNSVSSIRKKKSQNLDSNDAYEKYSIGCISGIIK